MSHMQRVRMSRKTAQVPRRMTMGAHPSGSAGNTGLDNGQQLKAPRKFNPFLTYPDTGTPKSAESPCGAGGEGKGRGRQSDKSSRTK